MRTALASLCLLAFAASAAAQTTWYVDWSSTPPGSGTLADPYQSLQYAIEQPTTLPHDTLLVAPGTYLEAIDLSAKPLRVVSSQGALATRLEPPPTASIGVELGPWGAAAKDFLLEGFTVQGNPSMSTGVRGTGTVRRCVVRDVTGSASGAHAALTTGYDMFVEECSVVGNRIGLRSLSSLDGIFLVKNSLVHGSSVVDVDDALIFFVSSLDHCTWGTGDPPQWWGVGNLKGDPGFWNPDQGDLRLAFGSSSIDSGDPASPLDPDGSPIDRGALTFDPAYLPPITVYCTAKVDSLGCTASMGASGGAGASASAATPFLLTVTDVLPSMIGLCFYGFGRRAVPFMGGWHCVEPPTPRVGGQLSGGAPPCLGSFAFDFNAHVQSGLDPALVPGVVVNAQWWYRDPFDPQGFGTATSDAIEFPIAP